MAMHVARLWYDLLLLLKNVCRPSVLAKGYIVSWKGWRSDKRDTYGELDGAGVTAACRV